MITQGGDGVRCGELGCGREGSCLAAVAAVVFHEYPQLLDEQGVRLGVAAAQGQQGRPLLRLAHTPEQPALASAKRKLLIQSGHAMMISFTGPQLPPPCSADTHFIYFWITLVTASALAVLVVFLNSKA